MAIKPRMLRCIRCAMDLMETCDVAVLPKIVASLEEVDSLLQLGLTPKYRAQYKEIIDGVGSSLHQANANELQEVFLLSKDLLAHAEKHIAVETHFRKEIVFLPYNAAMWDSMESVWQAAEADKDRAVAYVVPIPYCDRNPDGGARKWHCDAGKFPHYVPIKDYRVINLEKMHPDVIIIHNPYDGTNVVTSVHPDYYSRRLKSYTEKLVYIPYFVLEEVDPKNGEALKHIANFVLTPGVLNSDLTIVQSEDMREAYINILTQETNKIERSYWEKRILGLGSPKIDKVLSTKRENVKLPESWRRIIEKADGTRKKVIFYNVSLSNLLEHEGKLLDKMEWVFDVFRERQNEVALLWRPHPLFVSTLGSMKPELLARYRDMVKRYKREGWGIYDDTPDLHRSIAISDAYYGSRSSLVAMFRRAGKPVLIQAVERSYLKRKLAVVNIVEMGDSIFFLESFRSIICKLDKLSCKTEVCAYIPLSYVNGAREYGLIFKTANSFMIMPWVGNRILECDLRCDNLFKERFVDLIDTDYKDVKMPLCIEYVFQYEKRNYLLSSMSLCLIKYDAQDDKFTYFTKIMSLVELEIGSIVNDVYLNVYRKESFLYITIGINNMVLILNMRDENVVIHKVGEDCQYAGIAWDGKYLWLNQTQKRPLIRWDCLRDEIHEKSCVYYEEQRDYIPYEKIIYDDGKLILYEGNLKFRINTLNLLHKVRVHEFDDIYSDYILQMTEQNTMVILNGILSDEPYKLLFVKNGYILSQYTIDDKQLTVGRRIFLLSNIENIYVALTDYIDDIEINFIYDVKESELKLTSLYIKILGLV